MFEKHRANAQDFSSTSITRLNQNGSLRLRFDNGAHMLTLKSRKDHITSPQVTDVSP